MGRPAIVKVEEVEKLCAMQCTQAEIADFFGVSKQAIEKRIADSETLYPYTLDSGERVELTFREIMDLGYSKGKISQRRALLQAVQGGNVTAMIWFGKQYMSQRDNMELTGNKGGPLATIDATGSRQELLDRISRFSAAGATILDTGEPDRGVSESCPARLVLQRPPGN